jgi:SPX domain protein involved in polyphosphate accumulation
LNYTGFQKIIKKHDVGLRFSFSVHLQNRHHRSHFRR